jgi:hypothetical protein
LASNDAAGLLSKENGKNPVEREAAGAAESDGGAERPVFGNGAGAGSGISSAPAGRIAEAAKRTAVKITVADRAATPNTAISLSRSQGRAPTGRALGPDPLTRY